MSQLRTNSIVPVGGIPAGANGGGIIQVVQTVKTDTFTLSSTTFTDVTGFSVTITPRSTSNKIFIIVGLMAGHQSNLSQHRLLRDGSPIAVGDASESRTQAFGTAFINDTNTIVTVQLKFLDSPATTSAVTYKVQSRTDGGTLFAINRSVSDSNNITGTRTISTITAMEVSG